MKLIIVDSRTQKFKMAAKNYGVIIQFWSRYFILGSNCRKWFMNICNIRKYNLKYFLDIRVKKFKMATIVKSYNMEYKIVWGRGVGGWITSTFVIFMTNSYFLHILTPWDLYFKDILDNIGGFLKAFQNPRWTQI